jgi:integrase
MPDYESLTLQSSRRTPWNKAKLIGAKPPLRPKHVWAIRTRLMIEGRTRDLAMFNLAIDSKLRGCDVLGIKVDDIAPHGYTVDRATVRQRKTGRPVKFELTEQTRQAVDDYLRDASKKSGEIHEQSQDRSMPGDAPICTAGLRMDRQHRAGCQAVRHPFVAADESDVDLSTYRQPAGCPALARPH